MAKRGGGVFEEGGLIPQCTICHGRRKNNVDQDNVIGPNDVLQINQNWIWKKTDEVEEDDDETIDCHIN